MKEINKVLVCVDLSEFSRETIEAALALTRGQNTEILLFNVINSREVEAVKIVRPYLHEEYNVENFIKRVKEERQHLIEEMIKEHFLSDKAQMNILVRVGSPYRAILEAIETENIDLVVIACKGRSNLIGTLHGSNAEKVFRHSQVPVLSVRNRKRFGRNQ
ncbi:MAG: universal stress protein [Desulforhopalus sp.]|nr:universal stress protein [Desulforhopalus sp.]